MRHQDGNRFFPVRVGERVTEGSEKVTEGDRVTDQRGKRIGFYFIASDLCSRVIKLNLSESLLITIQEP